ncbi:TPA: hypothetical protein IUT96_000090 [Enterococcus faecalis]|nr:hypothetical protein [Enterococcus faecalis]
MNQRQKKKRMTKALKILNQAEVVECDYDSGGILYIEIENSIENINILKKACGLLNINKKQFLKDCNEREMTAENLDLARGLYHFIRKEPKKFTTFHSYGNGFSLIRF